MSNATLTLARLGMGNKIQRRAEIRNEQTDDTDVMPEAKRAAFRELLIERNINNITLVSDAQIALDCSYDEIVNEMRRDNDADIARDDAEMLRDEIKQRDSEIAALKEMLATSSDVAAQHARQRDHAMLERDQAIIDRDGLRDSIALNGKADSEIVKHEIVEQEQAGNIDRITLQDGKVISINSESVEIHISEIDDDDINATHLVTYIGYCNELRADSTVNCIKSL